MVEDDAVIINAELKIWKLQVISCVVRDGFQVSHQIIRDVANDSTDESEASIGCVVLSQHLAQ